MKTKQRKEKEKQIIYISTNVLFLTMQQYILNRTPFIYNGDDDDFLIVSKMLFFYSQEIPISSNKGETV